MNIKQKLINLNNYIYDLPDFIGFPLYAGMMIATFLIAVLIPLSVVVFTIGQILIFLFA